MSTKYSGGSITKSPVAPTSTAASGIWTLDQQQEAQRAGTWPSPPIFIEDLFSTWLYTGTGVALNINNGINLSGNGGLVWIKQRSGTGSNGLIDTARGRASILYSNSAGSATTDSSSTQDLTSFNSNGFSLGSEFNFTCNSLGQTFASWSFREQPKFFDIVTFTGNGASGQTLNHSLGSVPGFMIVKKITGASGGGNWACYHRSLGPTFVAGFLDDTQAAGETVQAWNNTAPTSTQFTVGVGYNASGSTYVAYLFAHNAGGFPASGTGSTNGISCGSFTTDGSGNATVDLGYEPQWVLLKSSSNANDWTLVDNMRGWTASGGFADLNPNNSNAEDNFLAETFLPLNATGFRAQFTSGNASRTYIYIAIRRGPMRAPTTGTSVFDVGTRAGSGSVAKTNSSVLTDLAVIKRYTSESEYWAWTPRLAGNQTLQSNSTDAELTGAMATNPWDTMTGAFVAASNGATNTSTLVDYSFRRAPGFFDVVCYTGTGSARTITHNLAAVPELMLVKSRSGVLAWRVYNTEITASKSLALNTTAAPFTDDAWNNTTPTSTVFSLGTSQQVNSGGDTFVNYLFASCPGVSKVGSYVGDNTDGRVINCGFTSGARFVLIRRVDQGGQWAVWDTARGIVSGNDPYIIFNLTIAQIPGFDDVDATSTGFIVNATSPGTPVNVIGATYIFLAIA